MQLYEILGNLNEQLINFIMDYAAADIDESGANEIIERLRSQKDLNNLSIVTILGYEPGSAAQMDERIVIPRGYRLLIHKAKIPMNISKNVVQAFGNMSRICSADLDALKTVEGIGVKRGKDIYQTIHMLKEKQ
jgi:diadenylate cyclase